MIETFTLLSLAVSAFPVRAQTREHPWMTAIHTLRLDSLPGDMPIYYSRGYHDRAEGLGSRLREAIQFFKDSLGVTDPVRLAVIDKSDWSVVSSVPGSGIRADWYGFDTNRGPRPWIILIPATGDGAMADILARIQRRAVPELWRQLDSTGMPPETLVLRHMDMGMIHELGHTLMRGSSLQIR